MSALLREVLTRPLPSKFKDRAKFIAFAKSKPPGELYSVSYENCPMTQFVGRYVGYEQIPNEFKGAIFNSANYSLTWGELAQRLEALP